MSTTGDPTQISPAAEARLDELAKEWSFLQDQRQPIDDRMEQIKNEYRQLLATGTTVKAAGRTISIQRNPTFDPAAFRAAYPVLKYPHLYTSVPDSGAIKENLSPATVRTFQKEGTPKVVIR